MQSTRIDTQVLVETPEGVDLQALPAGIVVRGLAFAIDFGIRIVAGIALSLVLMLIGDTGQGIMLALWFVITWLYNVLFEVLYHGQTPGKKALNIAVVHDNLTPVVWSTSMIRNLIRVADSLPFLWPMPIPLYLVGLLSMIFSKNYRRIGDMAAGTLVIYRESSKNNKPAQAEAADNNKEKPHAPPILLEREDQIAIIGFTQRQNQLSEDRQKELADIVGPILPTDKEHRVSYLRGIGHWLLGGR